MKYKILHVANVFLRLGIVTFVLFLFFERVLLGNSLHKQFLFYSLVMSAIAGLLFLIVFFIDYYLKKHIRSHLISFLTRIALSLIIYFPYRHLLLNPIGIIFNEHIFDGFYDFWMVMPLIILVFFFFNINLSALDESAK